jgi:Ca-activated chloride channel homolog
LYKKLVPLCLLLLLTCYAFAARNVAITRDFQNEDLASALRSIANEMKIDLYLGPDVKGRVTLKLDGVPGKEALRQVLATQNVRYELKFSGSDSVAVALKHNLDGVLAQIPHEPEVAEQEEKDDAVPPPPVLFSEAAVGGGTRVRSGPVMSPKGKPAPAGYMPMTSGRRGAMNQPAFNTESYDHIDETGFKEVSSNPLSTFSVDVDTAAYSNLRRFIQKGQKPPKDAVRIEEMLNYFTYEYKKPKEGEPFSVSTELSTCPWNQENQILQVGLAAPRLKTGNIPARNLVFLLDVSGSMNSADKLPLLKGALKLLVNTLRPEDTVSIVVYAGASGTVLEPTSGELREQILQALDKLEAGGSTNGGAGIELAYKLAAENFQKDAINRVILATDGDFNVGVASRGELKRLIEEKRETGIFLTVLGFGSGNLKDSSMEQLADSGNGNYAYIDTLMEAKKVLVEEAGGTLVTVAKDVKLQLEFNPLKVKSYRLVGYENRRLENEDFDNDKKDAGEMGAGHTVTALYEIVPGKSEKADLRYQGGRETTDAAHSEELALVKVRYKAPDGDESRLKEFAVTTQAAPFAKASENLRFAASVATVGMLLRDSEFKGDSSYDGALEWARGALGEDNGGYRREFVKLVELVQAL